MWCTSTISCPSSIHAILLIFLLLVSTRLKHVHVIIPDRQCNLKGLHASPGVSSCRRKTRGSIHGIYISARQTRNNNFAIYAIYEIIPPKGRNRRTTARLPGLWPGHHYSTDGWNTPSNRNRRRHRGCPQKNFEYGFPIKHTNVLRSPNTLRYRIAFE